MKPWAKWALVIGVLIAIGAALTEKDRATMRTERERPPTPEETKAMAQRLTAQQCVTVAKSRLHDPDSAKLPDAMSSADYPAQFYVGSRKPKTLSVQFEMRAKNGFGALRSNTVTCTFNETKEGYAFSKIDIWQN